MKKASNENSFSTLTKIVYYPKSGGFEEIQSGNGHVKLDGDGLVDKLANDP